MNHYHADTLRYALDAVLHLSTTVDAVTSTTKFTLHAPAGFLPGDVIQVTVGATTVSTVIQSIVAGLLTVAPAVPAAVAHGSPVKFDLAYNIYNYKDIASGEKPTFDRPCLVVTVPKNQSIRGIPQGWHPEAGIIDQTRVTLYLETPITRVAGNVVGGFDTLHHPAIRHLRAFIRGTQALDIPAALSAIWREGTVGMRPDSPYDEKHGRDNEIEQHIFNVVLWKNDTLPGG